ncbi:hypothetical protein C8Q73DRAFT_796309 [Cubamyces lactineus]|nr:hypothetical protein C8Q73DRAFT_796309 [Cubamyces lactineus]
MSMLNLYTAGRQQTLVSERSWYRRLFYDHPGRLERKPEAMDNDKVKVWCKHCFEKRVLDEQRADALSGLPVRETAQIEHQLWAQPKTTARNLRWIRAHTSEMLVHIRDCELQNQEDREHARQEHDSTTLSPRRKKAHGGVVMTPTSVPGPAFAPGPGPAPPSMHATVAAATAAAVAATSSLANPSNSDRKFIVYPFHHGGVDASVSITKPATP